MKKIITILMSILTLMLVAFSGVGCSIEWQFESDGKFKYYYLRSSDGYAIVGTEEAGFSDPMYIPAYYKEKPVVCVGYHQTSYMGGGINYSIDYGDATKKS